MYMIIFFLVGFLIYSLLKSYCKCNTVEGLENTDISDMFSSLTLDEESLLNVLISEEKHITCEMEDITSNCEYNPTEKACYKTKSQRIRTHGVPTPCPAIADPTITPCTVNESCDIPCIGNFVEVNDAKCQLTTNDGMSDNPGQPYSCKKPSSKYTISQMAKLKGKTCPYPGGAIKYETCKEADDLNLCCPLSAQIEAVKANLLGMNLQLSGTFLASNKMQFKPGLPTTLLDGLSSGGSCCLGLSKILVPDSIKTIEKGKEHYCDTILSPDYLDGKDRKNSWKNLAKIYNDQCVGAYYEDFLKDDKNLKLSESQQIRNYGKTKTDLINDLNNMESDSDYCPPPSDKLSDTTEPTLSPAANCEGIFKRYQERFPIKKEMCNDPTTVLNSLSMVAGLEGTCDIDLFKKKIQEKWAAICGSDDPLFSRTPMS